MRIERLEWASKRKKKSTAKLLHLISRPLSGSFRLLSSVDFSHLQLHLQSISHPFSGSFWLLSQVDFSRLQHLLQSISNPFSVDFSHLHFTKPNSHSFALLQLVSHSLTVSHSFARTKRPNDEKWAFKLVLARFRALFLSQSPL